LNLKTGLRGCGFFKRIISADDVLLYTLKAQIEILSFDLSNVIDYYRLLSEKIVVILQVNHRQNVVCMGFIESFNHHSMQ